jgi:hypothetical protein
VKTEAKGQRVRGEDQRSKGEDQRSKGEDQRLKGEDQRWVVGVRLGLGEGQRES